MPNRCLIVGAGDMGRAHLAALRELIPGRCAVVAKSERNRRAVEDLGGAFHHNGLANAIASFEPTEAIVASPVELLASHTEQLVELGVRKLLIEKPAGLERHTMERVAAAACAKGASLWVAYNRRFYGPVRTAVRLIAESGERVTSVSFEFTEWAHVVAALQNQSAETKAHWALANSMHVIDTAFLPVGLPEMSHSTFLRSGRLDWHPSGAVFTGAGTTSSGALFSYSANWDAPGRWGVEWMTNSARYIFRPMERLTVMRRGSVALEDVALDDDLDTRFKPGVYEQDRAFLSADPGLTRLASFEHAMDLVGLAGVIAGYAK